MENFDIKTNIKFNQLDFNYHPKADKKQTEFNNFTASLRLARHPLGEAFFILF